jgi:hypothetical protein
MSRIFGLTTRFMGASYLWSFFRETYLGNILASYPMESLAVLVIAFYVLREILIANIGKLLVVGALVVLTQGWLTEYDFFHNNYKLMNTSIIVFYTSLIFIKPWRFFGLKMPRIGSPKVDPISLDSKKFYSSQKWRRLRYEVMREHIGKNGRTCAACHAKNIDEVHVDHIRPRSKFPELALEKSNMQILCKSCNLGKSNYFNDGWNKGQLSENA